METKTPVIDQKKKLVPILRFGEYYREWKPLNFEQLYTYVPTNSYSRDKLNYDSGEILNIHYGDIHTSFRSHFFIEKEKVPFINKDLDIRYKTFCEQGDLVIADASEDYGDIGKAIEIIDVKDKKILAGLHTIHLQKNDANLLSNGFVGHYLQSNNIRRRIKRISQGTKVLGLSYTRLKKISVNLPEVSEQQKIASFLSSVDNKIDLLEQKKAKLEEYKEGVMQQIFSRKIRFKDKAGNNYPNWKTKRIGTLTEIYDGTHQTPKYVEEGIPFYSVEHVTANQFQQTKYISEKVYEKEKKRTHLEKNDILLTRIGDIGTSKLIDWDVKASFYVSLALIKASEKFNSSYLNQFIKSRFFQRELWKRTIHVAFPKKINLGEIGNCLVQLPWEEEQRKIAAFLTSIDEKIALVEKQIEGSNHFKKGLLQKMFV